jgi:hypothetical protein
MIDRLLVSLFWCVVDAVDYWWMQMRLGIVDAVCGAEAETAGDEMCKADWEPNFGWNRGRSCIEVVCCPLVTRGKIK